MQYQLMQQVGGKNFAPYLDIFEQPFVFDCPKKATEEAKRLSKLLDIKLQPRPIVKADWKAREQKRLNDGIYKPAPWAIHPWWRVNCIPEHFAHVSVKDKALIAFTKGDKEGSADIQTSMKPGKYLAEFFGKVLTPEEIRKFAMEYEAKLVAKELKFAKTPEEIQNVYATKNLGSCFSGTTKANLYGSGDFAVAYIETKNGDTKARAVCCPERKIYGCCYGDRYRLESLLDAEGYKNVGYDDEPWRGLRLLKEWHWDGFYTDFGARVIDDPKDKKFMVIA